MARLTVYRWMERWESVKREVERERDRLVDEAENALLKLIRKGNTTAVIHTLKTLGKTRGYVERQEVATSGEVTFRVKRDGDE